MPESFFSKVCNFIKKETLAKVFSCEFCKISKNTLFTEHLRAATFVSHLEGFPFYLNNLFCWKLRQGCTGLSLSDFCIEIFLFLCTEAATRGILCKKMFLEFSQNSQENTCIRVSFLVKFATLLKKRLWHRFPCESCEIYKNIFLTEHLSMAASVKAGLYDEIFLSQVVKFFFQQFPFNI